MTPQLPLGVGLPASAVFDTFHAGANAAAVAAVASTAAGDGEPVLYLHGETGSGRSHLLQAACASATAMGRRAAYLPLGDDAAPAMVEGWETYSLVCVDDIDSIAGNAEWERALFGLFNALRSGGGHWVAAGAAPPAATGFSLADLASRLGAGPVYRLQSLDDAGRAAALALHAHQRGFELAEDVARYLLARLPRDMGSLVETLDRIDHASLTQQRKVTIPLVRDLLADGSTT